MYASAALLPHAESEDSCPAFLNVTQLSKHLEIMSAATVFSDEHTQCYKEMRVCKVYELYSTALVGMLEEWY